VEGVVTPGQGVICNQRVVSWDFEGEQGQRNADGDSLVQIRGT